MALAVIVDWYGPFTEYDEFRNDVKEFDGQDLVYMGLAPYNKIQYVGISRNSARRFQNHHKLQDGSINKYWFGEIVSQRVAGRKGPKGHTADVSALEKFLIHWLEPDLNDHYKNWHAGDCISVFNRFFSKRDYQEPVQELIKFPRIMAWDSWAEEYFVAYQE